MTTKTLRYTLEQIEDIIFKGFDYQVSEEVMEKISNLAMQVGSPDYVRTPVFKKRDNPMKVEPTSASGTIKDQSKKRRGNKAMEISNDEEWDSIKTFQTTKIEDREGIEYEILPKIISSGHINKIKYLQIQFHDFVNNGELLHENITNELKKSHDLAFESMWNWSFFTKK